MKLVKEAYQWNYAEDFYVPEEVKAHFAEIKEKAAQKEKEWQQLFEQYKQAHPQVAAQLELAMTGQLPENWSANLPTFEIGASLATRAASGTTINALAQSVPMFLGGFRRFSFL